MNVVTYHPPGWVSMARVMMDPLSPRVSQVSDKVLETLYVLRTTAHQVLSEFFTRGFVDQSIRGIRFFNKAIKELQTYNLEVEEVSTIALSDRGGRFLGTFLGVEYNLGPGEGTETGADSEFYEIAERLMALVDQAREHATQHRTYIETNA